MCTPQLLTRFNPRTPGECDSMASPGMVILIGFNPRTPGGVRQKLPAVTGQLINVSIHALRGECDLSYFDANRLEHPFQSTHSGGSATWADSVSFVQVLFQSTHSGGSATHSRPIPAHRRIVSIHALRGECDVLIYCGLCAPARFNPRTPGGVRLSGHEYYSPRIYVSIHALRGECDHNSFV